VSETLSAVTSIQRVQDIAGGGCPGDSPLLRHTGDKIYRPTWHNQKVVTDQGRP
jgi:hypothetical protein